MNSRIALILLALVASAGVSADAYAQRVPVFKTINVAAEALASKVTLPSGPDSSLVMASCGDCALKSFPATRSTEYFLGDEPVTLGDLRTYLIARPQTCLTVSYSAETGELVSIVADIVAPTDSR